MRGAEGNYVGEVMNKMPHGKGEFTFDKGALRTRFIGHFIKGKRHGKGEIYGKNGKLSYKGEYKNDSRSEGISYNPGVLK
jgi:hypothetical protein